MRTHDSQRDVHASPGFVTGRQLHRQVGLGNTEPWVQLTADACRRPVVAGPVEATALGNLLVQARTHGVVSGDLAALRERIRETTVLTRYEPRTR